MLETGDTGLIATTAKYVASAAAGAASAGGAIYKWFHNRFTEMEQRIDTVEREAENGRETLEARLSEHREDMHKIRRDLGVIKYALKKQDAGLKHMDDNVEDIKSILEDG